MTNCYSTKVVKSTGGLPKLLKKDTCFRAVLTPVQPAQCSSCIALEGMGRSLTEQHPVTPRLESLSGTLLAWMFSTDFQCFPFQFFLQSGRKEKFTLSQFRAVTRPEHYRSLFMGQVVGKDEGRVTWGIVVVELEDVVSELTHDPAFQSLVYPHVKCCVDSLSLLYKLKMDDSSNIKEDIVLMQDLLMRAFLGLGEDCVCQLLD
ncbi:hypothetical protein J6590_011065 [Homalodisca vitripennis]|nr:hypothetical protein J6590_011065 [Homalodisca vitripennis]